MNAEILLLLNLYLRQPEKPALPAPVAARTIYLPSDQASVPVSQLPYLPPAQAAFQSTRVVYMPQPQFMPSVMPGFGGGMSMSGGMSMGGIGGCSSGG